MKTIFITISRGLIVRNILRGRAFQTLKARNDLKIVLVIHNLYNLPPPEYLMKELSGENIIFEFVPNKGKKRIERLFRGLTEFLVYTKSTKVFFKNKIETEKDLGATSLFLIDKIYTALSKINFLKKITRWLELALFNGNDFDYLFSKYNPDLIFSTAILSNIDIDIMKQAWKRGIKIISMPKSWDNLDKVLFRIEPDIFLVQNKIMLGQSVKFQAIPKEKIRVVGFPQFDIYKRTEFWGREEYCTLKNFDSKLPILFIGSEGKWSEGDEEVFKDLILAREAGGIPACNILIRPHFSTAYLNKYEGLKIFKNVFIDNNFRHSEFFGDRWDPTNEDQTDFANSLHHCGMMITFASTLALDTACFGKPTILLNYGIKFGESDKTAAEMYQTGHYEPLLKTNAFTICDSKEDVAKAVNLYLDNSDCKKNERQILKDLFCEPLDGNAGERIAEAVIESL